MLAIAKAAFRLFAFSLPFAKPAVLIGGLPAVAADAVYLMVVAALAGALATSQARLRWHKAFFVIGLYCAILIASALAAGSMSALPRLAAQFYLLSLPVLALALVNDELELRALLRAWLAGTAVCATIGVAALLTFAAGVDYAVADHARHGFGTLPPGPYPRLESTFTHPAMLCNYLTVSLAILMICLHRRWIGRTAGLVLLGASLATAAFTLTPGLGGIALLFGALCFVVLRRRSRRIAVIALVLGCAAAVAFVAVSVVTPQIHPTAPFLFNFPGVGDPLAPSVRLMAWIEAAKAVADRPLIGAGPDSNPIAVLYVAPSGHHHLVTDAHNVFLNIAMHGGLAALAAIVALVLLVARQVRPPFTEARLIPLVLGFAWLDAFAYQGLTGSYEDARHLWLLLGLWLTALRLQPRPAPQAAP